MTLVEVVVAIGLFGIIMVTIFPAFLILNLMNIYSDETTSATYLAQQHVEYIYEYGHQQELDNVASMFQSVEHGFVIVENNSTWLIMTGNIDDYWIEVTIQKNHPNLGLHSVVVLVESLVERPNIGDNRAQIQTVIREGD